MDMRNKNEVLMTLALEPDSNTLTGAQLFPIGEWNHPGGKIKITHDKAKHFADNFNAKLAGQDLPILYIHSSDKNVANPMFGKAAGWIKQMSSDPDKGVTIDIEFTDVGAKAVRDGEYRYLSAEYFDSVQLPHHTNPVQDLIVAAALVNKPHLKGMTPLLNEESGHVFLFSEGHSNPDEGSVGGDPVDPILVALAKSAGLELSEDVTELTDDERKAIESHLSELSDDSKATDLEAKNALLQKKLDDSEDPNKQKARNLAMAGFAEEAKLLSEYRGDKVLRELEEHVSEGHVLSPAVKEMIKAYGTDNDPTKLLEAAELMASGKGVVDLTEHGSGGTNSITLGEDSGDKLITLAEKIQKEREVTFVEAIELASEENPELYVAHQNDMGSKEVTG